MLYQHSGIEAQKMMFEVGKVRVAIIMSNDTLIGEKHEGLRKP